MTYMVTVHYVHSNLVKIHSKSPSVMGFCPVCLGILPYSWQTPRGILPVNSNKQSHNFQSFLLHSLFFSVISYIINSRFDIFSQKWSSKNGTKKQNFI